MGAHALLSPSASHRWLHCTASPMLEAKEPDRGSDYAREGSLAHAYCAKALKSYMGEDTAAEDAEIHLLRQYRTEEMPYHVESYTDFVVGSYEQAKTRSKEALLLVEQRLDFSEWIPKSFGTSDAIIASDGLLEVVDFKYGKGVEVSAQDNPQMMIYALGALSIFDDSYSFERVRMTIIQPRLSNYSTAEMTTAELRYWAVTQLKPKALEALSGKGRQEAGDWCRFCSIRPKCEALARFCSADGCPTPGTLSMAEIAALLPKIPVITAWAKSVEEYALTQAMGGNAVPGYKVVEGRSIRRIIDTEAAASALTAQGGLDPAAIYKPKELLGLTDLTRLVHGAKKLDKLIGRYIDKPKGKPTLAPNDDPRPAYSNNVTDDFKNIDVSLFNQ